MEELAMEEKKKDGEDVVLKNTENWNERNFIFYKMLSFLLF